jgi:hypothetical protein
VTAILSDPYSWMKASERDQIITATEIAAVAASSLLHAYLLGSAVAL